VKRFFVLLILCAMLSCLLVGGAVAQAENALNDSIHDIDCSLEVYQEGKDIVAVASIDNNPGIIDLYLRVEYDVNALELTAREFYKTLSALGPVDNFEEGSYEYPYRVIYVGSSQNETGEGDLFSLRFKLKEGAKNGNHEIKLVVRQVGYFPGNNVSQPVEYVQKYGEPVTYEDRDAALTGGVVATEMIVVSKNGKVTKIISPADKKRSGNELMIGLIVGGVMIFVGAIAIAYIVYRKKQESVKQ